jgi:hypothetical protein
MVHAVRGLEHRWSLLYNRQVRYQRRQGLGKRAFKGPLFLFLIPASFTGIFHISNFYENFT